MRSSASDRARTRGTRVRRWADNVTSSEVDWITQLELSPSSSLLRHSEQRKHLRWAGFSAELGVAALSLMSALSGSSARNDLFDRWICPKDGCASTDRCEVIGLQPVLEVSRLSVRPRTFRNQERLAGPAAATQTAS